MTKLVHDKIFKNPSLVFDPGFGPGPQQQGFGSNNGPFGGGGADIDVDIDGTSEYRRRKRGGYGGGGGGMGPMMMGSPSNLGSSYGSNSLYGSNSPYGSGYESNMPGNSNSGSLASNQNHTPLFRYLNFKYIYEPKLDSYLIGRLDEIKSKIYQRYPVRDFLAKIS